MRHQSAFQDVSNRNAVLEHGSQRHRDLALDLLIGGLLEYATNEQGIKSITKALKEGGKDTLDRIIKRMCEPAKRYVCVDRLNYSVLILSSSARRAMIVDLALSVTGSQLIASVLPNVRSSLRSSAYSLTLHRLTRTSVRSCTTPSEATS